MKPLAEQLRDMDTTKLITVAHDYMLTHNTMPGAYATALLHHLTRLHSHNRDMRRQLNRINTAKHAAPGEQIRREIRAQLKAIRAACDGIETQTPHLR